MTLLPAKPGLFLCRVSAHCTARARCYRSPSVRVQATGEPQVWCSPHAKPDGPCEEWRPVDDGFTTPEIPVGTRIKVKSVRVEAERPYVFDDDEPAGEFSAAATRALR